MPSPASVAAIIPVYNRPKVVLEAMESVAAQTVPPSCLLVVDDGSTDDTALRVESWLAETHLPFPARLLRQPNSGAAVARNTGAAAAAANSEVLAFLDSDDLWPRDFVQRVGDAFAQHPDLVATACDRVNHDYATGRVEPHCYAHYGGAEHAAAIMFREGPPGTSGTAFRTRAFQQVGGFDPQWPTGQDYDLMLRISLLGPWRPLPGTPLTTRNHLEVLNGTGEPPLSRKYPDRAFRRVQMLDRFITQLGGAAVVPEHAWRPHLYRLWIRAGRRLHELNRRPEAFACFQRALELQPGGLKARCLLLLLKLQGHR